MNRQPIEGTFKINPKFSSLFSKRHLDYSYTIIDSKVTERYTSVFIVPVTQDGKEASSRTVANLCQWANLKTLEQVN